MTTANLPTAILALLIALLAYNTWAGNGSIQHRDGERWPNAGRNVRSVWQIATQPYPEAHFATFPEELARRCILAGCPVRVCRVCGKPSERIVEGGTKIGSWKSEDGRGGDMVADQDAGLRGGDFYANYQRPETVGWSDCGCIVSRDEGPGSGAASASKASPKRPPGLAQRQAEDGGAFPEGNDGSAEAAPRWRPGVVLDPFIGSGTTAKVARDHQRHAIGIDLNQTYLELAARRLQQLSLLNYDPNDVLVKGDGGLTGGAYSPPGQSPHSNARSST